MDFLTKRLRFTNLTCLERERWFSLNLLLGMGSGGSKMGFNMRANEVWGVKKLLYKTGGNDKYYSVLV